MLEMIAWLMADPLGLGGTAEEREASSNTMVKFQFV